MSNMQAYEAAVFRPLLSGRWVLHAPLTVRITLDGQYRVITLPSGFSTDFASVPNLPLSRWLVPPTHRDVLFPALVHDYLYREYKPCTSRASADSVMYALMVEVGASWWRRWLVFLSVRAAGWAHWKRNN